VTCAVVPPARSSPGLWKTPPAARSFERGRDVGGRTAELRYGCPAPGGGGGGEGSGGGSGQGGGGPDSSSSSGAGAAAGEPPPPPLELGASLAHASNARVLGLAARLNLTLIDPPSADGGRIAVFDGARVVVRQVLGLAHECFWSAGLVWGVNGSCFVGFCPVWQKPAALVQRVRCSSAPPLAPPAKRPSTAAAQTGQPLLDALRLVTRYGLAPLRYARLSKEAARGFASVYALQDAGRAFETPREMLEAMGLWNLTQTSAQEHLEARGEMQGAGCATAGLGSGLA
jgi:hypothetical protein